jgi:hypothetical protein
MEYSTNSIFRILQGTVAVIFSVAIVKSKLLSKWICGAGVVIGAITIYAGLEVAYLEFGGLTTIIGISMIIYFIWVGILGGSYVEKINIYCKCKYIKLTLSPLHCAREEDELESAS